jgi:hypothetical protein
MHKAHPRVQLRKVLKLFGDWHAPIEAFTALAKRLRDIAQLVCCCCSVAARRGVKTPALLSQTRVVVGLL